MIEELQRAKGFPGVIDGSPVQGLLMVLLYGYELLKKMQLLIFVEKNILPFTSKLCVMLGVYSLIAIPAM